ncbi:MULTISPECIES: phosphate-starvation-inducible PsiE family protein [Haladaptatus]|nr:MULTISPECIES: phosphate-starvation-inducible PsiE family protein [Haladaptatus]GKZ12905.1 hypothetical protein HAL_07860 [Haladaptatus sp. T7]SHK57188.1 Phosphate-starvation-inducible E [Haladaptatus paucihalophilus DX253]
MDLDTPIAASESVMRVAELVAAYLLVGLFVVGLLDFGFLALSFLRAGRATDPRTLIELVDIVLLLFIVAEIYRTVIAYVESEGEVGVVRATVYAGIIALVRKAITFQIDGYSSVTNAAIAAGSYTLLLVGLGTVLWVVSRR